MKALRVAITLCLLASTLIGGPSFAAGFLTSPTTAVKPATSLLNSAPTVFRPSTSIQSGQQISNCYPFHRIANDFDYCTNTPVLH